jgi:hypothetical protein
MAFFRRAFVHDFRCCRTSRYVQLREINTPKSSFPVDNAPSVPTAAIDNVASPAEAFAKGLKRRIIKI